jgi:hypothetical protein
MKDPIGSHGGVYLEYRRSVRIAGRPLNYTKEYYFGIGTHSMWVFPGSSGNAQKNPKPYVPTLVIKSENMRRYILALTRIAACCSYGSNGNKVRMKCRRAMRKTFCIPSCIPWRAGRLAVYIAQIRVHPAHCQMYMLLPVLSAN